MVQTNSDHGEDERNWRQDKLLTRHETDRLTAGGINIHELKNEENASQKDLYKDRAGNIYVKPKGGQSPGEPTNLNINEF